LLGYVPENAMGAYVDVLLGIRRILYRATDVRGYELRDVLRVSMWRREIGDQIAIFQYPPRFNGGTKRTVTAL